MGTWKDYLFLRMKIWSLNWYPRKMCANYYFYMLYWIGVKVTGSEISDMLNKIQHRAAIRLLQLLLYLDKGSKKGYQQCIFRNFHHMASSNEHGRATAWKICGWLNFLVSGKNISGGSVYSELMQKGYRVGS